MKSPRLSTFMIASPTSRPTVRSCAARSTNGTVIGAFDRMKTGGVAATCFVITVLSERYGGAVPSDESVRFMDVAVGRRHAFFEHPHTLDGVEVVEDDPPVAPDDDDLPDLVRVCPADVQMAKGPVRIAQADEADIFAP